MISTITENKDLLSLCNVQCNLSIDIILITGKLYEVCMKLYEAVSTDTSQVNCAISTNSYNIPASC